jgi:hypothetical protein
MDHGQRRVPFLAPVFAAAVAAPVADAVRAALSVDVRDVPCPVCGEVVAVLMYRRLYRPGAALGHALGDGPASAVSLPCPCGRVWSTSGRAVARNLHNRRPAICPHFVE